MRILLCPVLQSRNNSKLDNLVAHSYKVLVGSIQSCKFLCGTCGLAVVNALGIENGRHCHHHLPFLNIAACRPSERLTAHCCLNHLNCVVCRALEGAAAAELDDVAATLNGVLLDFCPTLVAETALAEGLTVNLNLGSENCHSLTVSTIGVSAGNLALLNAEFLGKSLLETGAVESCKGGNLLG